MPRSSRNRNSREKASSRIGKQRRRWVKLRTHAKGGNGSSGTFFFFLCLCLATAAAAIIEVRNYIEYPCLQEFSNARGDIRVTLYHRGAARRNAAVFFEQGGLLSVPPKFVTRLFYLEENGERNSETERFEDLSWSRDGGAMFATRAEAAPGAAEELLWLYDFDSSVLYRVEGAAIPGRGAEASQSFLQRYLYERKGGPGAVVARWFELGRKENYTFSWETTRWNRAIETAENPPKPENPVERQAVRPTI